MESGAAAWNLAGECTPEPGLDPFMIQHLAVEPAATDVRSTRAKARAFRRLLWGTQPCQKGQLEPIGKEGDHAADVVRLGDTLQRLHAERIVATRIRLGEV